MTLVNLLVILASIQGIQGLRCACERDPSCDNLNTCITEDGGICFTSIFKRPQTGKIRRTMRCLEPKFLIPRGRPLVCEYSRLNAHKYMSQCCSDGDFCNQDIHLVLNITDDNQLPSSLGGGGDGSIYGSKSEVLVPVLVSTCILVALLCLVTATLLLMRRRRRRKTRSPSKEIKTCWCCLKKGVTEDGYHQVEVRSNTTTDSSSGYKSGGDGSNIAATSTISTFSGSEMNSDDYLGSSNSGSGSGLPLLVQRSVARQVILQNVCPPVRYFVSSTTIRSYLLAI
jgi:hypothetical protein